MFDKFKPSGYKLLSNNKKGMAMSKNYNDDTGITYESETDFEEIGDYIYERFISTGRDDYERISYELRHLMIEAVINFVSRFEFEEAEHQNDTFPIESLEEKYLLSMYLRWREADMNLRDFLSYVWNVCFLSGLHLINVGNNLNAEENVYN